MEGAWQRKWQRDSRKQIYKSWVTSRDEHDAVWLATLNTSRTVLTTKDSAAGVCKKARMETSHGSLTPMGVRALGARMRENCNTPLTLFWYLLFHMSASPFSSARDCCKYLCQNLSTPPYLLISCFFYLLFNDLSQLRQTTRAIINNANLRLDRRIESQFCVS